MDGESKQSSTNLSFDGLEVVTNTNAKTVEKAKRKRSQKEAKSKKSEEPALKKHKKMIREKQKKYEKGERLTKKELAQMDGSKKLKAKLKHTENRMEKAHEHAARSEILQPEETGSLKTSGLLSTWQVSQREIKESVSQRTADLSFNLNLDESLGPYKQTFTRNGKYLLLTGERGYISMLDWKKHKLVKEFNVKETVRDACFLHNETMFAVAQKKNVFIYDRTGVELHALKQQIDVDALQFLPYHWLLASIGKQGVLRYLDTSTGQRVAEIRTRMGACSILRQNPSNAILFTGHNTGVVSLWSPNLQEPLVKIFVEKSPVTDLVVCTSQSFESQSSSSLSSSSSTSTSWSSQPYLVVSTLNGQIKIFDLRNSYKEVHSYFSPTTVTSLDVSDQGLLSFTSKSSISIWKNAITTKQQSPYLVHKKPAQKGLYEFQQSRFVPFEDILSVSSNCDFSTLIVPGAGRSHFDSFEANPFEDKKLAREKTVHNLLDKLQPSMISLEEDSIFAVMNDKAKQADSQIRQKLREQEEAALLVASDKNKARGGSTSSKKWKRKRANIIDKQTKERKEAIEKAEKERRLQIEKQKQERQGKTTFSALDRFRK